MTIYGREGQRRLLETFGTLLDGSRLLQLEDLVAARGPIPEGILRRIGATIDAGKSYDYVADALNRHGVIAGMGGRRWTATKVRRAVTESSARNEERLLLR